MIFCRIDELSNLGFGKQFVEIGVLCQKQKIEKISERLKRTKKNGSLC